MGNTRHTYQLHHSNPNEHIRKNGLPANLSTEAQLWDLIIKKITYNAPHLLFPLIYEIYARKYPDDSNIVPLSTEYSVKRSDTKEISVIKADLTFCVNERDIYHFECEITYHGLIAIRMFEYDVHAALSYRTDSDNAPSVLEFPKSAVLFLQGTKQIPEHLTCNIKLQNGTTHEYTVPTVKVQSYTLSEIKEKHLCLLIPFLPIRFRRHIPSDRKMASSESPDTRQQFQKSVQKSKEELTSFFQETIIVLEDEVATGFLSEMEKNLILELLQKSMLRISYRNKQLCQEVYDMTEPVLKCRTDAYFEAIRDRDAIIADQGATIADQDAIIAEYKRLYGDLPKQTN